MNDATVSSTDKPIHCRALFFSIVADHKYNYYELFSPRMMLGISRQTFCLTYMYCGFEKFYLYTVGLYACRDYIFPLYTYPSSLVRIGNLKYVILVCKMKFTTKKVYIIHDIFRTSFVYTFYHQVVGSPRLWYLHLSFYKPRYGSYSPMSY